MVQTKQEDQAAQSAPEADAKASATTDEGQIYMYPGDAKTPSISVRAVSQEKADELYKAKLKETK